ncbi:MAG: S8 family serine peptidase [Desmonostoc vinosum HA7617-LM4]|jgi:hypothetical protein|nr:S8 family serine peptidase [Desmonostoc vinosum HA7617-LM4]
MSFTNNSTSFTRENGINTTLISNEQANIFDTPLRGGNILSSINRSSSTPEDNKYSNLEQSSQSNQSVTQISALAANANGRVAKTNKGDNILVQAITVDKADLIIQNAVNPTLTSVGSTVKLSYQVRNQGNGSADASTTKFYLSKDNAYNTDDVLLSADAINSIAAGAYSTETANIIISNGIAAGKYYLLYQADANGKVAESNESNNVIAKAIQITAPDLIIQNIVIPASVAIGTKLEFTYEVKNQGNGSAGASKTAFSLSRDTTIGNDDDIPIGYSTDLIPSLAPSAVFSQSISWDIDTTITAGKYYLMFTADGLGEIAESNENNNYAYNTQRITLTPIDGGGFNSITGYGLVNAAAAVAKTLGKSPFPDVSSLGGDNWGADLIKAPEVWAKGYTGKGIVVAVVDSGVDRNHPDLSANIWKNRQEIAGNGKDDDRNGYIDDVYGWNFIDKNNNTLDGFSHGTHVAGTIAAVKNDFGVTGIAYDAKIMPVKVFDNQGNSTGNAVSDGIRYAVDNGAKIINLSLISPDISELSLAIQYAVNKGAIIVSAAGNYDFGSQDPISVRGEPKYPAKYATKWGLAVGAVYYNRTLTDFSHRAGTTPLAYVTAPGAYFTGDNDFGIGIYSTLPGNDYGFKRGTSMATPHVTGVVALMLSAKSNLTNAQVRQIVTTTAGNNLAVT